MTASELAAQIRDLKPCDKLTLARTLLDEAREGTDQAKRIDTLRLARTVLSNMVTEIDGVIMYERLRGSAR